MSFLLYIMSYFVVLYLFVYSLTSEKHIKTAAGQRLFCFICFCTFPGNISDSLRW